MSVVVLKPKSRSEVLQEDRNDYKLNCNTWLVKNLGNVPVMVNGIVYYARESVSFQSGGGFVVHYGWQIDVTFREDLLTSDELAELENFNEKKQAVLIYQELYQEPYVSKE